MSYDSRLPPLVRNPQCCWTCSLTNTVRQDHHYNAYDVAHRLENFTRYVAKDDLSKELEQLAQKARDRKVSGDELKGGTFTISNQGAIGGAHFTPIVNKPEVAILGLGRGTMKPVARDGKVEIRMLTPLGLSYDHRVIDGGTAARFIVDLVAALQDFAEDAVKL